MDKLQKDLDDWKADYNIERPHQGNRVIYSKYPCDLIVLSPYDMLCIEKKSHHTNGKN